MNIIDDLIDKGLIKQTLKEEEIPLLWYTTYSVVDVSGIRKCLGSVLHDMFTVLPVHCEVNTPLGYITTNMLGCLRVAGQEEIEGVTSVLIEATKNYDIEPSLVKQVVQLAELNGRELNNIVDKRDDYDYSIYDYDELINNISRASDGNVVMYPVQIYVLLFTLLIGLLDKDGYDKYIYHMRRIMPTTHAIYKKTVAGIHELLTRDDLPIKDIIYSLWNTYIDMVARNCHITVEGGEV